MTVRNLQKQNDTKTE